MDKKYYDAVLYTPNSSNYYGNDKLAILFNKALIQQLWFVKLPHNDNEADLLKIFTILGDRCYHGSLDYNLVIFS